MRDSMQVPNSLRISNQKGDKDITVSSPQTYFYFLGKYLKFKLSPLMDKSLRLAGIAAIEYYQHHISPKKGYSCAHRLVHGGDSCSEYVKKNLADKSLIETTLLSKKRFMECNAAYSLSKSCSFKTSTGGPPPPEDPLSCIFYIIVTILGYLIGKNCGCNNR